MAVTSMEGIGNIEDIVKLLKDEIINGSMSAELTSEVSRGKDGLEVYLLVFEKYYMRVSSRASLSVLIVKNGQVITVDSIGGGAGQGPFFKMDWGVEEDFSNSVISPLKKVGFVEK